MNKSLEYLQNYILAQNISKEKRNILLFHLSNLGIATDLTTNSKEKRTEIEQNNVTFVPQRGHFSNKKAEQLERQELDEGAMFKEKLLANISHELRTPLNAIVGMGHLLKNTALDNRQQEFVHVINTGAENLLFIINDLLELSKLKANKIVIHAKPFSTEKLLSDLYSVIWFRARQKNIKIVFEKGDNIPQYIIGDYNRIYQILLNLLNNGIKFSHEGTISLSLNFTSQTNEKVYLNFVVKDTGIGIAEDKLENIFESFTQAHDNRGIVYQGTGSGLHIVKYLVEMMGGSISAKSELKKGTEMNILMPYEIPTETVLDAYLSLQVSSSVGNLKGKKILYIEDNDANVLYLKNMLADEPIEFDIAMDFTVASQCLNRKKYDCILSDVKLPDGNGIDFMETVRKNTKAINQKTPVIVITAGATLTEREKAKKIGLEGYISKPFTPDTLFGELDKVLTLNANLTTLKDFAAYQENKPDNSTYLAHLNKVMKGNKQAMVEMLDILLKQLPDSTAKIGKAVKVQDWQQVHFEAHKVKSTIGIVGLDRLHKLILQINENTRERKDLKLVPSLFDNFKKQGDIAIERLITERKKLAKGTKKKRNRR